MVIIVAWYIKVLMFNFTKRSSAILLCAVVCFSCQPPKTFDEINAENIKNLPKRSDTWFKKHVGKLNDFDKIDPYGNLSRDDYMSIAGKQPNSRMVTKRNIVNPELQVPDLTDLTQQDKMNEMVSDKTVSISVNEDIPLKEVLIELARRAEVDVEIDKDISGSVIFIAKDKPFSEVIDRLAKIAHLTYTFKDGVLKIAKDKPVIRTYRFSMLDIKRESSSSVNSSISVGGGEGGAGSTTVTSGSQSQLSIQSGEGDIWKSIEDGISEIAKRYSDPTEVKEDSKSSAAEGNGSSILSLNKKAGLLTVLATERQQRAIKEYLDNLHMSLTSQVLIESKVVEVSLNDQYSSGIDWNVIPTSGQITDGIYLGSSLGGGGTVASNAITKAGENAFKFSILPTDLFGTNYSLDASVALLQKFGVTRSLANPRLSTMNNQYAILNFSKNYVYFDVQLQQQSTQTTGSTTITPPPSITSEVKTVPVGVVLGLQPSIDLERNEISMSVRPTLTRVRETVKNPGTAIIAKQVGVDITGLNSDVPIVETRELDTVFRVKSGQIMVIGGLLEERSENNDTGLPGFSEIPYVGNVFKKTAKSTETVETVIFMKASIVPGQGVSVEDENYYNKFNSTHRPFVSE